MDLAALGGLALAVLMVVGAIVVEAGDPGQLAAYLPSSGPAPASAQGGSFDARLGSGMAARDGWKAKLEDRAHEIAYGLESAKRELADLIP